MNSLSENVLTLFERVDCAPAAAAPRLLRVTLVSIAADGRLLVISATGDERVCDWLDTGAMPHLRPGDTLLALLGEAGEPALVLGKVGRYVLPVPAPHLTLEAERTLTLKCGQSSIDLHADGKVMIRGDDVLVRAKGTQRIRAGTVSIN